MEESLVSSYVLYQNMYLTNKHTLPIRVRSFYDNEMHYWVEFQLGKEATNKYWCVQEGDTVFLKDTYYDQKRFQQIQVAQNGIFTESYKKFPKDDIERLRPFLLPCTSKEVINSFVLYQKFELKKKEPIRVRGLLFNELALHYWVEVRNNERKWFVYDLKDHEKPIIMNRRDYYFSHNIFYVQIAESGIFKEIFECFEPDNLARLREHVDPRSVFYTLSKQTYLIYETSSDIPRKDTQFKKVIFKV